MLLRIVFQRGRDGGFVLLSVAAVEINARSYCIHCFFQGGQSPGKVGEFKSGQGKCVLACTKFGQLVLRKIIEIVATRCKAKMHQI